MPGGYSKAASRVLTMLEETWQAILARHPEIPPVVVIIIASGTTGRDARRGRFESTPVTHLRGWYGERRPRPRQTPQRS